MTETSQPEKQDPQNVYELMENDDGEVMVLLFAGEGTPQNPSFTLDEANRLIELSRSKNDIVLIEGLLPNAVEKLKKLSVLYVCEMKYNENPEAENEILHAYAAALKKKRAAAAKRRRKTGGAGKPLRKSPQSKRKRPEQKGHSE